MPSSSALRTERVSKLSRQILHTVILNNNNNKKQNKNNNATKYPTSRFRKTRRG